jgi:transcriptional regulator with XRE-family HTH domain
MHASVLLMATTKETPSQRASRQLQALMKRHHIGNASEFEKMMAEKGVEPLISQVTIRRILKAEARTEPERATLRRLAEFLGETYSTAFPEDDQERSYEASFGETKIAFSSKGPPLSPSAVELIRRAIEEQGVEHAEKVHAAKSKRKP